MSFTIEYRGASAVPYIVGDLTAARSAADAALGHPLEVTVTEREAWYYAIDQSDTHHGHGSTPEAATRYLVAHALDALRREGADALDRLTAAYGLEG